MKNLRQQDPPQAEHAPRPLARSLLLYAVLGTLALQVAAAPSASRARQEGTPAAGTQSEVRPANQFDAKPLKQLLRKGARMHRSGELNLASAAAFTVEADIGDDGTLQTPQVSFTGGDAALKGFAHELVSALSESRLFGAMEGVRHVRLNLALDGQNFNADALADAATPEQAERLSSGYNTLLVLARVARRSRPESVVFNNMTVSSSGKQLSLKLDMTREALGNLLSKQVTPN